MWWDSSDRSRITRRSDVAFWLHLLAAPMIAHPVFTLLGLTSGHVGTPEAIGVVLLYIVFGVTALAVDRRALLVSALAYVLFALNELFRQFGAVELNVALTALVIGSALLLLSAFWHQARAAIVKPLPESIRDRLPIVGRPPVSEKAAYSKRPSRVLRGGAFHLGGINAAQHVIEMPLHGIIAAAGEAFQRNQVGDLQPATLCVQKPALLQALKDSADVTASNAEHFGELLLR
jgi:hypothetical protein